MIIITTYPVVPTHTSLPSIPSKERSRAKPELNPLVPTPHYSGRLDLIEPTQSSMGKVYSHRIINYYRPNLQDTSVYATVCSKKFNKDVVPPDSTSKGSCYFTSGSPGTPIQTAITGVASSPSPQSSITSIKPVLFDAASHLHDIIIPSITPSYAEEDGTTCPSVPSPDDVIKPILKVTCVDRTRLFWSDFKITWSPAWNDQRGCHRLFRAMERRGLVTGWSCKQAADNNGYIMQARGHRPRSPRYLVADAIREAFELVSIQLFPNQSKPWLTRRCA